MFFRENMLLALESLRSNKMRSILTMLGIIIGVSSVIAIMSVGNSLSGSITTQMQSFGTNNIMINVREKNNQYTQGGEEGGFESSSNSSAEDSDLITPEMLDTFQQRFKNQIDAISLQESIGSGRVKDQRLYANVSVTGVNSGYAVVNNVEMIKGRYINDNDTAGEKSVAVVSDKLVKNIFGNAVDPIGKEIKLYLSNEIQTYIVIGVYKYKDSDMFSSASASSEKDTQTSLYVPISLAKQNKTIQNYTGATVMTKANVNADQFTADVKSFFAKHYVNNAKWEVAVYSMSSQIATVSSMLSTVSIAISVIAAISLLVGGIGVMNIMLVTVTERTREIGTRKALGAKNYHIRIQFIIEAMILSLVGGMIGLILGLLTGSLGSTLIGSPPSFSVPMIILTILFSMAIGVFFGYYPANKAAKLDPIDALRYE